MRTFNEIFEDLMESKEFEYSAHTARDKKSRYKNHIQPIIGAFPIASVTFPIMQGLLNTMLKNGYSPKTVAHVRDIIRTVFAHAMRCEYAEKNPSLYLELKKIDNRCFLRLSKAQIVSFVSAVKNEPSLYYKALFLFLLHGRRLNEARCLDWSWIDEERHTVSIPAIHSKDRFAHIYALTDEFIDVIKMLPRVSHLVFPSSVTGDKFVDIRRPFERVLKRAGIEKKNMRIHDIRHLVGTCAVEAGMSLEDVKYALGHNSISTTMRYVTQNTDKSKKVTDFVAGLSPKGS